MSVLQNDVLQLWVLSPSPFQSNIRRGVLKAGHGHVPRGATSMGTHWEGGLLPEAVPTSRAAFPFLLPQKGIPHPFAAPPLGCTQGAEPQPQVWGQPCATLPFLGGQLWALQPPVIGCYFARCRSSCCCTLLHTACTGPQAGGEAAVLSPRYGFVLIFSFFIESGWAAAQHTARGMWCRAGHGHNEGNGTHPDVAM